ncbi:manganese efflux pump MntP family protein [Chloroflexota bacterium]
MVSSIDVLSVLLIAIGLSADCFAVSLGISISRGTISLRQVFRVSVFFGGFQAFMLILGWLAGRTVVEYIESYDHWLAFALLSIIGIRMIWESIHGEDGQEKSKDMTKGFLLLVLSIATSIDALAVGLTFAFLKMNILAASLTVGTVAFTSTAFAFWLGKKVSGLVGKRAEIIGGIILIGIGVRIILEHVFQISW